MGFGLGPQESNLKCGKTFKLENLNWDSTADFVTQIKQFENCNGHTHTHRAYQPTSFLQNATIHTLKYPILPLT